MIRRIARRGLSVARSVKQAAAGIVFGPQGPGHGVGEYEDFHRLRAEAAARDRAEGIDANPGDDLDDIADGTVEISAEDLRVTLEIEDDDCPTLIDVRERVEWRSGHLPQARLVPLSTLESAAADWDRDGHFVLYCASGMRSIDGSYVLKRLGFRHVHSLAGGIGAWQAAGNAVELPAC